MKKKNILLLHGWGAKTSKLFPLKKRLGRLGWNVVVLKLPGFENPAPDKVWGIEEYADYVRKEVYEAFGREKFCIFGHSFGGGIAIKFASDNPKNLKGVVLCAARGLSRGKTLKRAIFATLAKLGKVLLIHPILAGNFKRLLYKAAREHDYEKAQGIMRDIFKKVVGENLKPLIPKIKVPVLVLWGNSDNTTPIKDAYFIKSTVSKSKLVTYKKQGHRLPYEKPKELAQEINIWWTLIHS